MVSPPRHQPPGGAEPQAASQHDQVREALQSPSTGNRVQAKATLSRPGDALEREADSVAEHVIGQGQPVGGVVSQSGPSVHRQCDQCEEEVQRKAKPHRTEASTVASNPPLGGGQPMPYELRRYFEPRFGTDFGDVRLHRDSRTSDYAQSINARAFTYGQHIGFANGEFGQGLEGKRLLAHELTHVLQQRPGKLMDANGSAAGTASAAGGLGIQRQESTEQETQESCDTTYSPASNFQQLVDLVRAAESQLIACGYTDVGDRVHLLRGLYYGTTWSNDYDVEQSPVRNAGFQVYTASMEPGDPRNCFSCNMFDALKGSQDIVDGNRRVDFGHLIIGLDARRSSFARDVPIPSQGGTGLAISTWLGDLGGGAAMTAFRRVSSPSRRAAQNFRGTDFGGSINLEGDAAGFLVGSPSGAINGAPALQSSGTIADWLNDYLEPGGATAGGQWNSRCKNFLSALGGTFDASGNLDNRSSLIDDLAEQIEEFGCWYLVNRLRQSNRLSISTLKTASQHLAGASQETASIFVDALVHCHTHSGAELKARTDPAPSPIGSSVGGMCAATIRALEAAERARQLADEAERRGRELLDDAESIGRDLWDDAGDLWDEYSPF